MATARPSPSEPRPRNWVIRDMATYLAAIARNYEREGSGPGSRFEGRLLEDVQAEAVIMRKVLPWLNRMSLVQNPSMRPEELEGLRELLRSRERAI